MSSPPPQSKPSEIVRPQVFTVNHLDDIWQELKDKGPDPRQGDVVPEGCRDGEVCFTMDFTPEFCHIYANRRLLYRILQQIEADKGKSRDDEEDIVEKYLEIYEETFRMMHSFENDQYILADEETIKQFLSFVFRLARDIQDSPDNATVLSAVTSRTYPRETVHTALKNYEVHYLMAPGTATLEIVEASSKGIEWWAVVGGVMRTARQIGEDSCKAAAIVAEDTISLPANQKNAGSQSDYWICEACPFGETSIKQQSCDFCGLPRDSDLMYGERTKPPPKVATTMSVSDNVTFHRMVYKRHYASAAMPVMEEGFLHTFVERGQRHRDGDRLPPGCNENDVCMMRFTAPAAAIYGNRIFYAEVWFRKKIFQFANEEQQEQVVSSIIDFIHKEGGRFMYEDPSGNILLEATRAWARAHVRMAFSIANSSRLPGGMVDYRRGNDATKKGLAPRHTRHNHREPLSGHVVPGNNRGRSGRALDRSGRPLAADADTVRAMNPSTPSENIGDYSIQGGSDGDNDYAFEDGSMIRSEISGELYEIDFAMAALRNYESFNGLKLGTAKLAEVEATSAGVEGWAFTVLNEDSPEVGVKDASNSNNEKEEGMQDKKPAANPFKPQGHRRGDDEERRALQMALLQSVGVRTGPAQFFESDDGSYAINEKKDCVEEGSIESDEYSYEYNDADEEEDSEDEGSQQSEGVSGGDEFDSEDDAIDEELEERGNTVERDNAMTQSDPGCLQEAAPDKVEYQGNRDLASKQGSEYDQLENMTACSEAPFEGVNYLTKVAVEIPKGKLLAEEVMVASDASFQTDERGQEKAELHTTERSGSEQVGRKDAGEISTPEDEYSIIDQESCADKSEESRSSTESGYYEKVIEADSDSWNDSEDEEMFAELRGGK